MTCCPELSKHHLCKGATCYRQKGISDAVYPCQYYSIGEKNRTLCAAIWHIKKKRLTNAGICTIISQTVPRCTGIYPIIFYFWNIQHALITHIFFRITWSPSYCGWGVSFNLAVKWHTFFSSDVILILKCDLWRNCWEEQKQSSRHFIFLSNNRCTYTVHVVGK